MKTFNWKSATPFTLASMTTGLVMQACGDGDGAAIAQSTTAATAAPEPLEGTWQSEITIRDCTTGAVTTTFHGLTAFHRSGTVAADNNMPPGTNGIAAGTWKKGSTGRYDVSLRFFRTFAERHCRPAALRPRDHARRRRQLADEHDPGHDPRSDRQRDPERLRQRDRRALRPGSRIARGDGTGPRRHAFGNVTPC